MSKLYPPYIEGKLPAFYNTYNSDNTKIIETTLKVPFGINRAVDRSSIKNIALRIRTTSTNIDIKTNYLATQYDSNEGIAIFKFTDQNDNQLFKENQYYRVQLAFVDTNDEIGYYSSIGIIKCIAKPTVEIVNYDLENINMFNGAVGFLGQYKQDTRFGDSTEKEYSYIFNIYDKNNNIVATSGEKIHDITEDNLSNISKDLWKTYQAFEPGEVYYLQYTVTTINGLVLSTIKYKVMEIISSPIEFNIQLHTNVDYDNGLIELTLQGAIEDDKADSYYYQLVNPYHIFNKDIIYFIQEDNEYIEFDDTIEKWEQLLNEQKLYMKIKTIYQGEKPCNGQFVITRSSAITNFMDWVEITRFSLQNQPPSIIYHQDTTVEQGIEYKYALQQYNTHGLYSKRQYQTDKNGNFNTVVADFDSIFLTDGIRQLKVYFNPEISSFKNTILEDKIETIGSKYPYIVRNGTVSYKEFPIAGLISYKMDNAKKFLTQDELLEAGLLENNIRQISIMSNSSNTTPLHEYEQNIYFEIIENKIRDPYTNKILYIEQQYVMKRKPNIIYPKSNSVNSINIINIENQDLDLKYGTVKQNTDLISETIRGERYFKLKVLEWLSDGKVKLFRSPTEGNYLVRLVNISLSPQNELGRMLHSFNCTAYEIDDLTYDNLIKYGIVIEKNISNIEEQWSSIDIKRILQSEDFVSDNDGFIEISPIGVSINTILVNNFIPGDQIKVIYENGTASNIFTIGVTGSLEINKDDRKIAMVFIKPNIDNFNSPARELIYSYSGITTNSFNTVSKISIITRPSEQFIGPKEDLLSPFDLKANIYKEVDDNGKITFQIDNEETGIATIYDDLINKNHINYNIGIIKDISKYEDYNAKKFTVLKIDHLHVWKREIIPIFAYDQQITENTKFGLTPFGKGYVNNQSILNYIDIDEDTDTQNIRYSENDEDIIKKNESNEWINSNKISIEDLETLISNNIYYANDQTLIFQAFIFDNNINDWVPSSIPGFQYYDNFTKKWWDKNIKYDASFSINSQMEEQNENKDIISIGDNIIYLDHLDSLTLYNLGLVSQIKLGNGVIAEITPQIRITTYDIEDTIEEIRQVKEDYENSKKKLFEDIEISVVDASSEEELLLRKKKLLQEKDTAIQKIESLGNIDPFKSVSDVAEERLIEQKQQIWYDRQAEFNEILDFLTHEEIYDKLEATNSIPVCVGLTITEDKEQIKSYLEELQEKVNKIYSPQEDENGELPLLTENDLFSRNTRSDKMYLHQYPETLYEIDGEEIVHDFINESYYIDLNYYLEQRENNLKIIENYNQQIIELQQQQGDLIGDYTSDNYTSIDAVPANTIVYYDYLIKQAKQQQENELIAVNKTKVELINQLLRVHIDDTMDILKGISNSTAEYLYNNAGQLSSLLDVYYRDKSQKLLAIQNQCAVNLAKIIFNNENITIENIDHNMREEIINYILEDDNKEKNNIIIMEADRAIDNTNSKLLDNILNNIVNNNENDKEDLTLKELITLINTLKENKGKEEDPIFYLKKFLKKNYENLSVYIEVYDNYALILKIELNALNDQLNELNKIINYPGDKENSYDIYSTPDYSGEHAEFNQAIDNIRNNYVGELQDYINTLLTLEDFKNINNLIFTPSSASVNTEAFALLDLFTNESNRTQATIIKSYLNKYYPADTDKLNDELIKQIKNQDALYAKKIFSLDKSISEYTAFKDNIQNEVDILQSVIDELEQKQKEQRKNLEFNNQKIAEAEKFKGILDSPELFNSFINNIEIQDNVTILQNYLSWVEYTEDVILQQAGKMNSLITDGNSYINWFKKYIDIYEEEAFDFLHKYDAIKPDLASGLNGENISPNFVVGIDKYMYNLKNYKLNVYENILYILDNEVEQDIYNIIMPKISSQDKTIRLEGYNELLLYLTKIFIGEKDNEKIPITFGMTESGKLLSLISDNDIPESIVYPTAYTIGQDSEIFFGIDNNKYTQKKAGEKILRDKTQNKPIFEIQLNEENKYKHNIYNTSYDYYTYGGNEQDIFLFNSRAMDEETFDKKVSEYKEKNQSVYWIGDYPPVSITIDLHPFLYKTDLTDFEVVYDENDENHIILQPTLLNQFKNFLGHIVHYNTDSGEEFGSYYSLLDNDLQLLNLIGNYFTAKKQILEYEDKDEIKSILQHEETKDEYSSLYSYWRKIFNNCEIVRDGYDAEGMSDDDEKKKQLIILLETAREKQQYYLDLIEKEEDMIQQIEENSDLSGYTMTQKSLTIILERITKIQENFNKNYEIYRERVEHYLNLLFNEIPYGKNINTNIIVNSDILHINNEDTSTYNLGIAYMIEKFQDYILNDEQFDFEILNQITQNAKNFKVILNYNFPLYEKVSNLKLKYDNKLRKNYYEYEEEADKYTPYLYIDEEKWNNDLNKGIIYYIEYSTLGNFINYTNYYKVNDLIDYSTVDKYYILNNQNKYIKYNIENEEEFLKMKERLYFKGNGGLKTFLKYIWGSGEYINDITINYNGTLELIHKLLTQIRGDNISTTQLEKNVIIINQQLEEIEILLNKISKVQLNVEDTINDIKQKLAKYLYILTVNYIYHIEGVYDV